MSSVLLVSELYYPEETSTGYFVTGIAEGLAATGKYRMAVLCSQPTYARKGVVAPKYEQRNGVYIRRLAAPCADKNRLVGRSWSALSLSLRFGLAMLKRIKRGDVVIVLTNPPTLPFLAVIACLLKRAKPVLLVHDVYPDVLVPVGLTSDKSFLFRSIEIIQRQVFRKMDRIVVLGRDMRKRVLAKLDSSHTERVVLIPNWGDQENIVPSERLQNRLRENLDLKAKFVVQFSGNLGRTHGLQDLVSLAKKSLEDPRIHYLVFGWGAGRDWLSREIESRELSNITLLEPCDREELCTYLTACDIFMLPMKKGMEGISVPSRLYNVMAAGTPVLAVCGEDSELAYVVQEEKMGWVVEPNDVEQMFEVVMWASCSSEPLKQMGENARQALEEKYTKSVVVRKFVDLLEGMQA